MRPLLGSLEAQMHGAVQHIRVPTGLDLAPATQAVLADVRAAFGAAVAPFALQAVAPPVLDAFWTLTGATLFGAAARRVDKELVAGGVSMANACPYCVDAHAGSLYAQGHAASAEALVGQRSSSLADETSRGVLEWARSSAQPGGPTLPSLTGPARAEVLGTALGFHYLNRVVSVFLPESPFPGPALVRRLARRNMGRLLKPQARDASRATAVALVEPLSPDLQWTAGSAAVAAGVLTMDRAMEATRDALPRGVASSVDRYLVRWTGAAPPLGQDWLRDAISGPLTAQEQAAVELALWVVVAPARVTTAVVDRARPACPDDRRLFGLVAWSSWRAARRVATWLA